MRIESTVALLFLALAAGCAPRTPPRSTPYPEPKQAPLALSVAPIRLNENVKLTPRAHLETEAYVMAIRANRFNAMSDVIPADFALAWGAAATPGIQDSLSVAHTDAGLQWEADPHTVLYPRAVLVRSMANVRMVPASVDIANALGKVRAGDTVSARGMLVDVSAHKGIELRTSLSRNDEGKHSSEIFYVTHLRTH